MRMETGSRTGNRIDHGPAPYVANIAMAAKENDAYRAALWTGEQLQLTLMSIPPRESIGLEVHPAVDQYIRVEEGQARVLLGRCREHPDAQYRLTVNEAVFVPAGTWHDVVNCGSCPLKLSSVYAPPQHPRGTVHCTKRDAEKAER